MEEDKKAIKKPHVLVIPTTAQGHINPMLEFCKRLVAKGVKTTLVNSVYISKSMHINHISSSITLESISDGFDEGGFKQAKTAGEYLDTQRIVGLKDLTKLIKKLDGEGNTVNAIVYDSFLPWVLDVAKKFGLVSAVFFTQSCAVNNIYYHVHKEFLHLPLSGSISLPGLPPLQPWETPSFIHIYGSFPPLFNMVVDQFSNIDQADWVLFNIFYDLEEKVLKWMANLWRVRTVGPTVPSMYLDKRLEDDKDYGLDLYKPNHEACMNWLNEKPRASIIYVSFGSMAEIKAEQLEEIAWGLNKTNFYYLWVVRESEERKLPNNFMNEKSEKGLIVQWSPQLEVLSHESVGCFVTHCGFNSVLEALSLGVAMVGIPQWTDQPTNAKFVEDVWGVGVRTKADEKGIVRRAVLESSIRQVMEGEKGREIKKNAAKWKNLAKEAVDEGGSSDKNIDEFVAKLKFLY